MPVTRLSLAVPKLSHIPHAESLATALLQVLNNQLSVSQLLAVCLDHCHASFT